MPEQGVERGPQDAPGISVLLVDDHPVWRETINELLRGKGVASTVVEASSAPEALELVETHHPDVVVMDIDLPGMNGVEATRRLVSRLPEVRVLVLSGIDDRADVVAAVRAGAAGYLLKTAGAGEIADAVARIASGEVVFPPNLAPVVLEELRGSRDLNEAPRAAAILTREGDVWSITSASGTVRVRDTKGLVYLGVLLAQPEREFHVSDLAARVEGTDPSAVTRHDDLETRTDLGDAGPVLDRQAKEAYRTRMNDLAEELQEAEEWADTERAARIRAELDALTDQLSAAVGLGGRDRRIGSAIERQRVRVTKAIRIAIRRITEADAELGAHLSASIRTGLFCSYSPRSGDRIEWTIEQ